jgi:hypothetical protein
MKTPLNSTIIKQAQREIERTRPNLQSNEQQQRPGQPENERRKLVPENFKEENVQNYKV